MIFGSQTQTQTYQEESQPPGIFYPVLGEPSYHETEEATLICSRNLRKSKIILLMFQDRLIVKEGSKWYCMNLDDECFFGYNKNEKKLWFQNFETKDRVQFKAKGEIEDFQNFIDSLKYKCPQQNFYHQYVLKERKGKGKHGEVFLAERKLDNQKFAIKIQQKSSKWNQQMQILKKLHHPNLIYLRQYFIQNDHKAYIVMDYEDGGNLLDKISPNDKLSYRDKLKVVIDMMNALEFLRIHNIVHRDIKPENILYSKKDGNYKLADFGLAIKAGQKINKISGTPGYLDPEILQNSPSQYIVDIKSDIYAMGLTFYQIFTSKQYYEGKNSEEILLKNSKSKPFKKKSYNCDDSQGLQKKLIQKMIRTKPQDRKNSFEIMSSSTFNKISRFYCEQNFSPQQKKQKSSTSEQENIMATMKKLFKIKTTS